jgi:hypothetical protein
MRISATALICDFALASIPAVGLAQGSNACGWIGVQVTPMTQAFADSLGMAEAYGAIFGQPEPGGRRQCGNRGRRCGHLGQRLADHAFHSLLDHMRMTPIGRDACGADQADRPSAQGAALLGGMFTAGDGSEKKCRPTHGIYDSITNLPLTRCKWLRTGSPRMP